MVERCAGHMTDTSTHLSLAAQRLGALGHRSGQSPFGSSLPTATRLWLDWADLSARRSNIRRANDWGLPGSPVHHLDEVLERSGYGQGPTDEDCDSYLSQLTAIAKSDQLAARIVVQRILPGLIATALRRGRIVHEGASGALDELSSAAWVVIAKYPIERRSRRVAANLLRDIEYHAFVRDARTKRARSEFASEASTLTILGAVAPGRRTSIVAGVFGADESFDPTAEAAEITSVLHDLERLGLRSIDMESLHEMLSDKISPESAREAGISARALRDRRANAVRRARELLNVEDEDCS